MLLGVRETTSTHASQAALLMRPRRVCFFTVDVLVVVRLRTPLDAASLGRGELREVM